MNTVLGMGENYCPNIAAALQVSLTELFGSRQAALTEGGRLLGIGGRIILATDEGGEGSDQPSAGAQEAIQSADLVVLALEATSSPTCAPSLRPLAWLTLFVQVAPRR
jgi:hypothetical protein